MSGPISLTHPDSDISTTTITTGSNENDGPLVITRGAPGVRSLSSAGESRKPVVGSRGTSHGATFVNAGGRSSSPVPIRTTTTLVRGRSPSPVPVRTTTTVVSPRLSRRVRRRRSVSRRGRRYSPFHGRGGGGHYNYYNDYYGTPSVAAVGLGSYYHDTELNNEIKKATCDVRCGKNLTGPYTSRGEQQVRSTCQLKCYRNNFVRVSGDEKCDLTCGAKYGTTDRNDPYGKEVCRRYDCAYLNIDDPRPIYRA